MGSGPAVYLGYDQAALDAQYTGRDRIPGYEGYPVRWAAESEAARRALSCLTDLPYGPSEAERLDVYPGGPGSPIHVFFHGGYWYSQDKRDYGFPAPGFVAAGVTYVAANYGLCPGVGMPVLLEQCRRALAHIAHHGAEWGADPRRIGLAGHSAGGHILAALMATDWKARGVDPAVLRGGVAISGLYDLEPLRLSYVNRHLRLDAATARATSPIHHRPRVAAPLLLAVGGDESDEFRRQQAAFAEAWSAGGGVQPAPPIETATLPGRNHFSILDDYAAGPLLAAAVAHLAPTDGASP